MLPFFLRTNIALLFLSALPLWAADDYPEFLKHLGNYYVSGRVSFNRTPTDSPLDPRHRDDTADAAFGAHGAYRGRALEHRRRTKTRPSQADLDKLRAYLNEQRHAIHAPRDGFENWSFEALIEMYRLTGIYGDRNDRNPSDLFEIYQIC